jgi:hypothetical protein
MKVFNVALIVVLSSIVTPHTLASSMTNNVEWNNDGHSSSNGNGGFSTATSCLQGLYSNEDTPLTCTGPKFWESISMEAPPTCIMGTSLDIEKLSFLSTFTTTAYDFSVRCVCVMMMMKNTNKQQIYIVSWCSSSAYTLIAYSIGFDSRNPPPSLSFHFTIAYLLSSSLSSSIHSGIRIHWHELRHVIHTCRY